jgi:hypothetical protein
MFAYGDRGKGQLWHVNEESKSLPEATPVALPDLHGSCEEPLLLMMAGTPDLLFLAEAFGFKLDRRRACGHLVPGGIYAIHPQSGQANLIDVPLYVNRMVASADGRDLYVIQSDEPGEHSARRLLRLDAATGRVRALAPLEPGVWNLALAHVPASLIPHGSRRAAGCSRY